MNTYLKKIYVRVNTEFNVKNKIRIGKIFNWPTQDNPKVSNNDGFNNPVSNLSNITDVAPSIMPVYDIMGNWSTLARSDAGPSTTHLEKRATEK